jgi:hypothetical protein
VAYRCRQCHLNRDRSDLLNQMHPDDHRRTVVFGSIRHEKPPGRTPTEAQDSYQQARLPQVTSMRFAEDRAYDFERQLVRFFLFVFAEKSIPCHQECQSSRRCENAISQEWGSDSQRRGTTPHLKRIFFLGRIREARRRQERGNARPLAIQREPCTESN